MRAHEGTARRYAKALFELAHASGEAEAIGRELEQLAAVLAENGGAHAVLTRPWIKPVDRRGVATAIAQKIGARKLVQDFVGLVAERGRARAQVRTAVAFTDAEKQKLSARLEQALGKRIILEEQVDASLLGGFIAQVGSLILDGSLDGQLARMRQRLARG